MKILNIINSQEWLNKLIKMPLDIKVAFKLKTFIIDIDNKMKAFNDIKNEYIKKYWEEKDWNTVVKEENIKIFNDEISKLLDEEIEINIPEIKLEDIKWDIDTATLIQLDYLIKE